MPGKIPILTAALVGLTHAQEWFWVPPGLTGTFCNGLSRPDWDECEAKYVDDLINTELHIGPDFGDGVTFTYENCEMKYVQCTSSGYEWVEENPALFAGLKRQCGALDAAGVQRQGDLCLVVQDPKNPLTGDEARKRETTKQGELVTQPAWPASQEESDESGDGGSDKDNSKRAHPRDMGVARDLVEESASLERRQECSGGGTCYSYDQSGFAVNIRGPREYVCNDVLPNGGSCSKTRSVTVTETYTVGLDVTAGLKDAVDIGASFSSEYSEAVETSLRTTITIDCPDNGSGYIVWYPLMQVSSGQCNKGTCSGGYCLGDEFDYCTIRRPTQPSEGTLSGEYDYICI
ncbi:uncharacterized protein J7T54_002873 [Emericellopsis cladophorae]|uniref:Chitin-binding type-2 domain-containing protein n=1 Tax=Emericellopsis cladophorae TaxID=2686198 RepID=A0A9Q0BAI3_9HYPO|nr:uncharacterized protein J7T54_002873 [Emericellopsis cladophorae]KAI6777771.1 hypothetical protein J7T54_002873 [Emericellopsis cladophorae]